MASCLLGAALFAVNSYITVVEVDIIMDKYWLISSGEPLGNHPLVLVDRICILIAFAAFMVSSNFVSSKYSFWIAAGRTICTKLQSPSQEYCLSRKRK